MDPSTFRLTQLSHGGGCGCKIAPAKLQEILKSVSLDAREYAYWIASRPYVTTATHQPELQLPMVNLARFASIL
jgi:selenophosphate synthase